MTREEFEMRTLVRESDVIDRTDGSELAKAFNYPWEKYVEQEPCEDCVSRQAVLIEIDKYLCGVPYEKSIDKVIKDLPPVTPKPKTDVLDKIRAEIMDFEEELFHRPNTDYADYAAVRHCVEIIDKHKAESEDEK